MTMLYGRYVPALLSIFLSVIEYTTASVHPDATWSYSGNTAPDKWHKLYKSCSGSTQSPINIQTEDVMVNKKLGTIDLELYKGSRQVNMSLLNNGHSVEVVIHGKTPEIHGGGLPGVYKVVQFHFHWGHDDRRGSEHLINGDSFPMEMHVVHYNTEYDSVVTAADKENGLAVLGFFFQIGDHNYHFDPIINHLIDIGHKDDHRVIQSFSMLSLLPNNTGNFWRYYGSLTTPPCYESVVWTLFEDKIIISEEQLEQFRHNVKKNYIGRKDELLADDYRPVQTLNQRTVYANNQFGSDATCIHQFGPWNTLTLVVGYVLFIHRKGV